MDITEYVSKTTQPLHESNFTQGDSLVLSYLSYCNFSNRLNQSFHQIANEVSVQDYYFVTDCVQGYYLLKKCGSSPHLQNITILEFKKYYSKEERCQFSATLYDCGEFLFYAICGTDATIVGWAEDFDLLRKKELPCQRLSVDFFNEIIEKYPDKPIYLGGHSKGGNCAIYVATHCQERFLTRITRIFNFDGPGFSDDFYENIRYKMIEPIIEKYCPSCSFYGVILNKTPSKPVIGKGFWVMQHDSFHWDFTSDGSLIFATRFKRIAYKSHNAFQHMMDDLTAEQKELFCTLFTDSFAYAGIENMGDFHIKTTTKFIFFILKQRGEKGKLIRKIISFFLKSFLAIRVKKAEY